MAMIGSQQTKSVSTINIMFLASVICFLLSEPLAIVMVLLMLKYIMVYPIPITRNPTKLTPTKTAMEYSQPVVAHNGKYQRMSKQKANEAFIRNW